MCQFNSRAEVVCTEQRTTATATTAISMLCLGEKLLSIKGVAGKRAKKWLKRIVLSFLLGGGTATSFFLLLLLHSPRPQVDSFSQERKILPTGSSPTGVTQAKRLKVLNNGCRNLEERDKVSSKKFILEKRIQQSHIRLGVLIGEPPGRLSYCHVPKAGSTAWMSVMAGLNGFSDKEVEEMAAKGILHQKMLKKYDSSENKTYEYVSIDSSTMYVLFLENIFIS